jgi:hypothetical protein
MPWFGSAGYYPLWGLFIAPAWLFTQDAATIYRAASIIGIVVGLASLWPVTRLVQRMRLTTPQALTVAAVVMALPGRAIQADYVLSERLLFLTMACTALAAFRLWERTTRWRAVVFSGAVTITYLAHVRAITVVLVSAIWLVALAWKRWQPALVGVVVLAGGYVAAAALSARLNTMLTGSAVTQGDGFFASLQQFHVSNFVRVLLSQSWAQFVGSFGLVALGFVAIVIWCWREVTQRRLGRACWIFGTFLAGFLVSCLGWASTANLWENDWERFDPWVYTRYMDPVTSLLSAVGLAVLVAGVIKLRVWLWTTGATLAVACAAILFAAPMAPSWAFLTPAHTPGILPWAWILPSQPHAVPLTPTVTNANRFWWIASLSMLAVLALLWLLRRHTRMMAVAMLAVAVAATTVADATSTRQSNPWTPVDENATSAAFYAAQDWFRQHDVSRVGWDFSCPRPELSRAGSANELGFALQPDVLIERVDSAWDNHPGLDVIFSCTETSYLSQAGARRVEPFTVYSAWLWVMPGELQDTLERQGQLASPNSP